MTLFDSGHNETEGMWCGPMPLARFAGAAKETEDGIKRVLSSTGLKQKSRQNWMARIDNIRAEWSDAFVASHDQYRKRSVG